MMNEADMGPFFIGVLVIMEKPNYKQVNRLTCNYKEKVSTINKTNRMKQ